MRKPSKQARVPLPVWDAHSRIAEQLHVPVTDAFLIRDKMLRGDFIARPYLKKGKDGVWRWILEIPK